MSYLSTIETICFMLSALVGISIIAMFSVSVTNERLKRRIHELSEANASILKSKDEALRKSNEATLTIFRQYREAKNKMDIMQTQHEALQKEMVAIKSQKQNYRDTISRRFMQRDDKGRFVKSIRVKG